MILSKERLIKEQKNTGFRQEIIEKVVWLIQILNSIADDGLLKTKLALKGGTALNLFHFNLPRLSVDADLNFIGDVDRETVLRERIEIEMRIQQLLQSLGLTLFRNPKAHAGGKMVWRYPSALGNQGNVEIDLNFMYRIPLLPLERRDSIILANQQVSKMQVLDIHEIAAGKFSALIDRSAGRDFFDAYHLFEYKNMQLEKLRQCFVIYAAISSKKNFLSIDMNQIVIDGQDLKNKLIPVLKQNYSSNFTSYAEWIRHISDKVKEGYKKLLPFNENELLFLRNIKERGLVEPELVTNDQDMINKIKNHPAILWAIKKSNTKQG